MNLEQLINDGEEVKARNIKDNRMGGQYINGEEYDQWIAKCIIFLENNADEYSATLIERFKKTSERAVGNGVEHYNKMMGILKALKEMT